MNLTEMFDPPISGYQDITTDNSRTTYKSSRKTKLTLMQIRKLRRMLDVRHYEKKKHLSSIRQQYGPKPENGSSMPPM